MGEVRESDHISCKGWGNQDGNPPGGQPIEAWRDGANKWSISVNGGPRKSGFDTLEFLWWDDQTHNVDVYARWEGDDFFITRSDGTPVNTYHELRYFSTDYNQTEWWRCHWDPAKKLFVHTRL